MQGKGPQFGRRHDEVISKACFRGNLYLNLRQYKQSTLSITQHILITNFPKIKRMDVPETLDVFKKASSVW